MMHTWQADFFYDNVELLGTALDLKEGITGGRTGVNWAEKYVANGTKRWVYLCSHGE